jgi:hypothetical protein
MKGVVPDETIHQIRLLRVSGSELIKRLAEMEIDPAAQKILLVHKG